MKPRVPSPASTYRRDGTGATLGYHVADSCLGRLLVASTASGLAFVALGDTDPELLQALREALPAATLARGGSSAEAASRAVRARLTGAEGPPDPPLDVPATAFQWRVWEALRDIPRGEVLRYADIAAGLGVPGAARAVGRACAANPVAVVVPCHRAIGSDGRLHGYRWGLQRKARLIEMERAGGTGAMPAVHG